MRVDCPRILCEHHAMFTLPEKFRHPTATGKRRGWYSLLAILGYLLSPLSWWNDLVVNIPLAYVAAWPVSLINERLFFPAVILAYWLTNLLGFILLHRGVAGLASGRALSFGLRSYLFITFAYTLVIALLLALHWLPLPQELFTHG
jgi:hypothetical protein